MEVVLSALTGVLFATGVYFLLRRSIVKLVLGIIFLSNATFLLVFISGGLHRNVPAFIVEGERINDSHFSDPLTQALVLTAIVIGFGIAALILVVKYKYHDKTGSNDLDQAKETEDI